jgi:hypothetical protein
MSLTALANAGRRCYSLFVRNGRNCRLPDSHPNMNFDLMFHLSDRNRFPLFTGWRRKGEWRWQRPS